MPGFFNNLLRVAGGDADCRDPGRIWPRRSIQAGFQRTVDLVRREGGLPFFRRAGPYVLFIIKIGEIAKDIVRRHVKRQRRLSIHGSGQNCKIIPAIIANPYEFGAAWAVAVHKRIYVFFF